MDLPVTTSPKINQILEDLKQPLYIISCTYARGKDQKISKGEVHAKTLLPIKDVNRITNHLLVLLPSLSKPDQTVVYIWLVVVNRLICRVYDFLNKWMLQIKTAKQCVAILEKTPRVLQLEFIIFDLQLEISQVLLDNNGDQLELKNTIRVAKDYYDRMRRYSVNVKAEIDKTYGPYFNKLLYCTKGLHSSTDTLMKVYVMFLYTLYKRYYTEFEPDLDKSTHYGILSLKCESKYEIIISPAEWINEAVNLSLNCLTLNAPCQAHYLLRAATAMYNKHKDSGTLSGDAVEPEFCDKRVTKHLLNISYARFYHWCMMVANVESMKINMKDPGYQKRFIQPNSVVEFDHFELEKENTDLDQYDADFKKCAVFYQKFRECLKRIEEANLPKSILRFLKYDDEVQKIEIIEKVMPGLDD